VRDDRGGQLVGLGQELRLAESEVRPREVVARDPAVLGGRRWLLDQLGRLLYPRGVLTATALLDAARRYLRERFTLWVDRYTEAGGHDAMTTDRGRALFPRYNVVEAILVEIERRTGDTAGSIDELRAWMIEAPRTTRDMPAHAHPIEQAAITDERAQFVAFVRGEPDEVEPLPFRRTLSDDEHDRLHDAIRATWGVWYGGYVEMPRAPAITIHTHAMSRDAYDALRRMIDAERVLEAREHGPGRELARDQVSFEYDGAEGFWTDVSLGWLVYASHESSITFSVDLAARMREVLSQFDRYLYKGWDLASYDLPR
jgi:hypothetical protein